jgi:hypothetical protein
MIINEDFICFEKQISNIAIATINNIFEYKLDNLRWYPYSISKIKKFGGNLLLNCYFSDVAFHLAKFCKSPPLIICEKLIKSINVPFVTNHNGYLVLSIDSFKRASVNNYDKITFKEITTPKEISILRSNTKSMLADARLVACAIIQLLLGLGGNLTIEGTIFNINQTNWIVKFREILLFLLMVNKSTFSISDESTHCWSWSGQIPNSKVKYLLERKLFPEIKVLPDFFGSIESLSDELVSALMFILASPDIAKDLALTCALFKEERNLFWNINALNIRLNHLICSMNMR